MNRHFGDAVYAGARRFVRPSGTYSPGYATPSLRTTSVQPRKRPPRRALILLAALITVVGPIVAIYAYQFYKEATGDRLLAAMAKDPVWAVDLPNSSTVTQDIPTSCGPANPSTGSRQQIAVYSHHLSERDASAHLRRHIEASGWAESTHGYSKSIRGTDISLGLTVDADRISIALHAPGSTCPI